jgi:hypothetical protein
LPKKRVDVRPAEEVELFDEAELQSIPRLPSAITGVKS